MIPRWNDKITPDCSPVGMGLNFLCYLGQKATGEKPHLGICYHEVCLFATTIIEKKSFFSLFVGGCLLDFGAELLERLAGGGGHRCPGSNGLSSGNAIRRLGVGCKH